MREKGVEECDSKRITGISIYKPKMNIGKKKTRLKGFHFFFLVLYIYQSYWCISTIGEPYRKFLEKADREGFAVMEGTNKMRAELHHALQDLDDPDRPTEKIGWFDWMNMDIEEHADRKKREKEQSVLDSLPKNMRVPKKHMPSFLPMLLSGIFVTLHVLVMLLQHWSVRFNIMLNYNLVQVQNLDLNVEDDCVTPENFPTHARLSPSDGKDVLVPLVLQRDLGLTFEFHRRRYVWNSEDDMWTKIRCKTNIPTTFISKWEGFSSETQVDAANIRFGKNIFDVKQPTFSELYKKQLLSPFTVFQLFCVILWLLDDYWQYSFFNLFMILMFEGTVVFTRIKSLNALKGMGNKSRKIYIYRMGQWAIGESHDLLPGDIFSLTRKISHQKEVKNDDEDGDIVPADLILLRGSTVVNEASLTGESVPQMKEGLSDIVEEEEFAMKGKHKMHVLYAGTKLLQCKGPMSVEGNNSSESIDLYPHLPPSPDNGCTAFVLRTGFLSSQGKLVRMIEGSQEKVKGHERETALLLLLLCVFACISSGYVLHRGLQEDNRSHYELLLHCILIITSVIPPELPMQMALAVNSSLMTLMKMQVFCTEPYRVPIAGKLNICLFDKTGTLTTDELVAVGLCQDMKQNSKANDLIPMTKITNEGGMVLAGCHSLVFIEGETAGDPLENAALSSMRWQVTSKNCVPQKATEKKDGGKNLVVGQKTVTDISILMRHHFSSKLQRMSCVIKDNNGRVYSVAKGSPEAIGVRLKNKPDGYEAKAKELSKSGYRVIALAYKQLKGSEESEAMAVRAKCEEDLIFAGFIAFTCRVRKDTRKIVKQLKEGGMSVIMVTGDALLTAVYVAKEVDICSDPSKDDENDDIEEKSDELKELIIKRRAMIQKMEQKSKKNVAAAKKVLLLEKGNSDDMYWQSYDDDTMFKEYIASEVPEIAKTYDLAVTGKNLSAAFEYDEETKKVLSHIKIFARMTPDAKETIIECMQSVGHLCLMCGDGANDVGALKQSDVGVALLSGFGDLNVDKGEDGVKKKKDDSKLLTSNNNIVTREELHMLTQMPLFTVKMKLRSIGVDPNKYPELTDKNDLITLYRIKAAEAFYLKQEKKNKMKDALTNRSANKEKARMDIMEKQLRMAERVKELEAQGESWAQMKAMKEFMAKEMEEGKKKKMEMAKKHSVEGSAASLAAQFEELEMDDLPMVKLGDASIAAPFTSKMPSIKSCVDIIRQGRCTLVSSMQMYQILALNCLISAYSLSVLYLDGVKYGDVQMTAMGMLMSVSFMSVSRSKPLKKLSSVCPLTSIFHPSLFISLLGQFAIHLITMVMAVQSAKKHLPPDYKVELDGEFKPGIVNTVVFLVSNVQQVTVFVVNLQGRPFMSGLTENRPLLWSLLATFILTFMFASESVPSLNKYFQLVPFPDDAYRDYILGILVADVFISLLLDRLMKFIFCPKILYASVEGTTISDVWKLSRTIGIILAVMVMLLGNDEQWEELLLEEARLNAIENATNGTVGDTLVDVATSCVGAACGLSELDEL